MDDEKRKRPQLLNWRFDGLVREVFGIVEEKTIPAARRCVFKGREDERDQENGK
jgi:hypothetical protein